MGSVGLQNLMIYRLGERKATSLTMRGGEAHHLLHRRPRRPFIAHIPMLFPQGDTKVTFSTIYRAFADFGDPLTPASSLPTVTPWHNQAQTDDDGRSPSYTRFVTGKGRSALLQPQR